MDAMQWIALWFYLSGMVLTAVFFQKSGDKSPWRWVWFVLWPGWVGVIAVSAIAVGFVDGVREVTRRN